VKNKRILNSSLEEVLNKYQGFEGELIAFFEVKGNDLESKEIINKCEKLRKSHNCLMLHVISGPEMTQPSILDHGLFRLGFDVGICEEEKTIYSSVFNEILFGHLDDLVDFKDVLNKHLLFAERALAEKYVALHNELSVQGRGVEDYEEMTIYEVWKSSGSEL
jgi:hypothetical protein